MDEDPVTCGSFLQCLYDPVQQAVLAFLGAAVSDCLSRSLGWILAYSTFKRAVEVPLAVDPVVGREQTLLEIRKHLKDDAVGIIGMCGMGGVGKTTVLKKINNDLVTAVKHDFDIVIFLTISTPLDAFPIQQEIGDRLGLTLPGNDQSTARVQSLYQALSKKKFLLLLDDVWEKLDLESIGIPDPRRSHKKAKVVFATRSKQVCIDMVPQRRVEVSPFNDIVSWNLFSSTLQPEVPLHDPVIKGLAEDMARKCGGLPLALATMGKAMSNANTVGEWEEALILLRGSPDKIHGMEEVFSIVMFSFDRLRYDVTRECLLYCCLFPEGYSIKIEKLVEYWTGEGFLDAHNIAYPDSSSISRARGKGYSIIRELKNMYLLESGDDVDTHVRMHNIVWKTALWLMGNNVDRKQRFMVCDGDEQISQLQEWESARRISLMQQEVVRLPSPGSECPNLLTLLVAAKPLRSPQEPVVVPVTMFQLIMPVLRVLDLSHTNIREIPREIGLLLELRYLNLSRTKISALPEEVGSLLKLRHLGLWGTVELRHIPRKAIVTLIRLQRLLLYRSGYSVSFSNDVSEGISWGDLDHCLQKLEEFSVDIHNTPSLDLLSTPGRLSRCIKGLRLVNISDLSSSLLSSALEQLVNMEWLSIEDCHQLEEFKITGGKSKIPNLKYLGLARLYQLWNVTVEGEPIGGDHVFPRIEHLELDGCDRLSDVGWLQQLPSLKKLLLWSCKELKVLLPPPLAGSSIALLPRLKYMGLINLPALMLISSTAESLPFPSLESLWVSRCPLLRRLPFTEQHSCEKIREIFGSQEWWDSLEWEVHGDTMIAAANQVASLRSTLHQMFHPISSSSPIEIAVACRQRFLA